MELRTVARQLPLRLAAGAFFLNSGSTKRKADRAVAERLQQFAATAYPIAGKIPPKPFLWFLSTTELAVATAMLVPVVPAVVAGAGVTAFSLGTLGLYLRAPGMREEDSLRPTEQGSAVAKDIWILGIGLSLIVDGLFECRKRRP